MGHEDTGVRIFVADVKGLSFTHIQDRTRTFTYVVAVAVVMVVVEEEEEEEEEETTGKA